MRPMLSSMRRALIGCVTLAAISAFAQAEVAGNPPPPVASESKPIGEYWAARLRYGIAYRSGGQQDSGPGLTYSGVTPNDLALLGWAWLGYAGAHVQVQREGFALFDNQGGGSASVTNGGLLRFAIQAAGRLPLGPLRLEPYVGYAFHQLPTFRGGDGTGSTLTPAFGAATRHGLLVAARLLLELGPVAIEARGEVPIALATQVPGAARAASNGYAVGGGVRVQVANLGKLHVGALLDGQYVVDNVVGKDMSGADVVASQQSVVRGGLSLDLQWRELPPVAGALGGIIVRVLDVDTNQPLPGADVTVTAGGEERPLTPDANGALALRGLSPGPFSVRASADGYLPFESAGAVSAGSDVPIEVKLKREPPRVGAIAVAVKEIESQKVLAGVSVTVGDSTVKTNDKGVARFEGLKPGPVSMTLELPGYQKGEEAASVVASKTTDVAVTLVPVKKKIPATITGAVRSTKGGTAIAAELEVPQAKIKTRADEKGAFSFRVDAGTYTVKISAPGYITQTKDVTVKDGDQAIFNVDLYPK
ncbi:MAG: carboxypeptidase regulatory-like domain-containing protein [Archangiaceae bacterium]|nr:carboxypeptidase regulatory-like domain-containing protein [Archangiaceae bacterium]